MSGFEVVPAAAAPNAAGIASVNAWCPAGKRAIGGGATVGNGGTVVALVTTIPILSAGNSLGWHAMAVETQPYDTSWLLTAYAICATTQ